MANNQRTALGGGSVESAMRDEEHPDFSTTPSTEPAFTCYACGSPAKAYDESANPICPAHREPWQPRFVSEVPS